MQTCPLWDEIRAEGRVEGRAEGRVEGMRAAVLHQGRHKFGKAPTKKQQKALEAITDPAQLQGLAVRLLDVDSWAELLREPQ
jgi:predicted transposase YdaD